MSDAPASEWAQDHVKAMCDNAVMSAAYIESLAARISAQMARIAVLEEKVRQLEAEGSFY